MDSGGDDKAGKTVSITYSSKAEAAEAAKVRNRTAAAPPLPLLLRDVRAITSR